MVPGSMARTRSPQLLRVSVGTVVKELVYEDSRRVSNEWEAEYETLRVC